MSPFHLPVHSRRPLTASFSPLPPTPRFSDLSTACGGGLYTPGRGGSFNRSTPRSIRTPSSSSRGEGSYAVRRAIAPDPIPFIDLESDEEEQVVDLGLAWARDDYQATKHAGHSAEQQQLMDTMVDCVVDVELARAAEQARAV